MKLKQQPREKELVGVAALEEPVLRHPWGIGKDGRPGGCAEELFHLWAETAEAPLYTE